MTRDEAYISKARLHDLGFGDVGVYAPTWQKSGSYWVMVFLAEQLIQIEHAPDVDTLLAAITSSAITFNKRAR